MGIHVLYSLWAFMYCIPYGHLCIVYIQLYWYDNKHFWIEIEIETLAQVMACCLLATSHYLNQCWLIISKFLCHLPESNFTVSAQAIVLYELEIILMESLPHLPGANELNSRELVGQSSWLVFSMGVWFIQIYVAQATHGPNNWPSLTILPINQWSYDQKFIDIPVFLSWIKYYEWESTPASNSSDGSLYHTTCMSVQLTT